MLNHGAVHLTQWKKNKLLDFVKLEDYKEVIDFCNIKYPINFQLDDAVNITSELHDLHTLVTIPTQQTKKT